MSVLFYYEPFFIFGSARDQRGSPWRAPAPRAARLRLICDDSAARRFVKREFSSNWDLFARLLKSLTVRVLRFV